MKRRTEFFYYICNDRRKLWILSLICAIGVLISIPALFVVDSGSATYYVTIINIVGLGLLVSLNAVVIYGCRRKFGD